MPRASAIQTAFNAGEWSERMAGRVDLPGYAAACALMVNFRVTAEGPADHRGGTYFVAATKDSSKFSRLVPFKFSTVQAYILEFGDQYIRVYKDYGQVFSGSPATVVEIATTYLEADLPALAFTQSADVLYICHNGYPTAKLTRTSHVDWTLAAVNFNPPATEEDGLTPAAIALTLSAASGTGITATAGSAVFLASDVGRQIKSGAGLATITAYTDTTHVTADVVNAFAGTAVAAAAWTLLGSPVAQLTPSAASPIGAVVTLTLNAAGWRSASDVGRYVKVSGGFLVITVVSSTTVAKARILRALDNTTAAAGGTWTLLDPAWSAANGWPGCATFFQERLWFGGSSAKPTTLWGSVTADFENFAQGGDDDASVTFTLSTDQVNAIQWLIGQRDLGIGTTGGEFTLAGSATNPTVTPDSVNVTPQSARGSAKLPAIVVGSIVMFAQRSRRKIRQYRYSYADDAYVSPEVTLRSRHITESGIVDMAYQQEPEGILWCAREDGQLVGLTFDDDEAVQGWHRHILGGSFGAGNAVVESLAVIPSPDGEMDDLWLQVRRTVNGQTFRSIEYLTPGLDAEAQQVQGYFVDCGLTYDGTAETGTGEGAVDAIAGLDHLEGQTVHIVADGATHPTRVVSGGEIALNRLANVVHVGLYAEAQLMPMRIEAGGPDGTAQGKPKRLETVAVRFVRTLGGRMIATDEAGNVETEPIVDRTAADKLGLAPPLFSGDKQINNPGGWGTDGQVEIVQDQPLPMTVAAMMPNVVVNKL